VKYQGDRDWRNDISSVILSEIEGNKRCDPDLTEIAEEASAAQREETRKQLQPRNKKRIGRAASTAIRPKRRNQG
jgi:hypothetical protein